MNVFITFIIKTLNLKLIMEFRITITIISLLRFNELKFSFKSEQKRFSSIIKFLLNLL